MYIDRLKQAEGKVCVINRFHRVGWKKNGTDCEVLIISPLLSIMKEQSGYLTSIGFTATYIGQGNNKDDLVAGKYQFVFSSPESILSFTKWRDFLTSPPCKNLELFVVDEAHTVLQW